MAYLGGVIDRSNPPAFSQYFVPDQKVFWNLVYYHVNGIYFETYDANAVYASVQTQEKTGRIRLRFGSTAELKKAVQDIVYRNNLTSNAGLRITLDEVMCVLRIDKIA